MSCPWSLYGPCRYGVDCYRGLRADSDYSGSSDGEEAAARRGVEKDGTAPRQLPGW